MKQEPPEPDPAGEYRPRTDRDRLRWAMGWISRQKREIQYLTGSDPLKEQEIISYLDKIESELKSVRDLKPYDHNSLNRTLQNELTSALKSVSALKKKEWTGENVEERFKSLESTCGDCHKKTHPAANRRVKITDVMPNVDKSTLKRLSKPAEEDCGSCHQDVLEEWKGTLHQRAWVDPIYRKAAKIPGSKDKLKSDCTPCHAPMPMMFEPFSVSYRFRPRTRPVNQKDAVNCKTCHLRPDGRVAARHTKDAPCKPTRTPRLLTPEFCSSCHNPTHNTYYEWQQSRAAEEGKTCADCHTSSVERTTTDGGTRTGVRHDWHGAHDKEFVKTAVSLSCNLANEERKITLKLTNKAAHKFPGEVPTRQINISITGKNSDGTPVYHDKTHYRRPLKAEVGRPDNRLRPDETRTVEWTLPEKVKTCSVTVHFQPSPFTLKNGWFELGSWSFELPE